MLQYVLTVALIMAVGTGVLLLTIGNDFTCGHLPTERTLVEFADVTRIV